MSILESVHPSIPATGIIVDPTFAATVGTREATALAHTSYDVMTTPLGQKVLRAVELNRNVKDADERFEKTMEYLKGNGVNVNEHTADYLVAVATLFVNGTVSVQIDRGIVGSRAPMVESQILDPVKADEQIIPVGNTVNPADQQQKNKDGSLKQAPEKPKQRDS